MNTHEDFSRGAEIKVSSNRTVGLVLAGFLLLVGLKPVLNHLPVRMPVLGAAAILGLLALLCPVVLGPVNKLWTGLAVVLHKITTPLVTGVVFFLLFAPVGLVRRWMGSDSLRLRSQPDASTYWIARTPPGPGAKTMEQQF
jgi:hypothetical protein